VRFSSFGVQTENNLVSIGHHDIINRVHEKIIQNAHSAEWFAIESIIRRVFLKAVIDLKRAGVISAPIACLMTPITVNVQCWNIGYMYLAKRAFE